MKIPDQSNKQKAARASKDKIAEDLIGSKLRTYYGAIESEEIPPQFLDLLDQLEKKTSKPGT